MPLRLSTYLKREYGEKIYRLSLSSGCGCPNRDGTTGDYGGCSFCSEGGSGEFASAPGDIGAQIESAKALIRSKTDAGKFIAYFQSYTNTYGDPVRLEALYKEAIERDDIVALSLGTRPDCLGPDILKMLRELNSIKPVWIELGLQTIHDETARHFRRGYDLPVFEEAYRNLKALGITVIVHVIFGLPGESPEDMLDTVRYLANLDPPLDGIKIQNLQILKGTDMYREWSQCAFHIMTMEEYTDLVAEAIALLPEKTVVHRMQGDGPRRLLVAPLWSLDKKRVLNMLTRKTKGLLE
ncbi:TIGR01212 family radical SAM protein [Butyrivibrio sp. FCS014]|uniref:TIGR01212 family radical SAM protein n=1 Tax=Butyrivibrio sp. FCS014 TaxID=1408304 RepID=UPI0004653DE9|nr:TIGR01212 family radical SAM protein [Butyrivibrio sp. FCS014]